MEIKIETRAYNEFKFGFGQLLKDANATLVVSKKTAKYIEGQPLVSIDAAAVLTQVNTDLASATPSFLELLKIGVNLANAIPNCKLVEPELKAITGFVDNYRNTQYKYQLPYIIYSKNQFVINDEGKAAMEKSLMTLTGNDAAVYQKVAELREFVRKNLDDDRVLNRILSKEIYFNDMGTDEFKGQDLGYILLNAYKRK